MVERRTVLMTMLVACGSAAFASAQPKPPAAPVVGAIEVMKVTTPTGFVDDVVAFNNQRLAYVVADASTKAELHVVQFGCTTCIDAKQEIVVDLAPITLRPTTLRMLGQRVLVIGASDDGNQVAAVVDLTRKDAKPVYKLGPATHITLIARDGKPSIAVHKAVATKVGTRHDVELFSIETGKRTAKGRSLELANAQDKKLDFRVNHWSEGWTRAGGLKGGEWVKKENQRSPDTEATYDLIAGKFVENKPIGDLMEQRKRYQTLADAAGQLDFLRMRHDNSAVEIWRRGTAGAATLDQPLSQYDAKSLQGVIDADGSAWIALKVDPVNAEAVARQKADLEYLDVYRASADGAATRKARILAKGVRYRFGVIDKASPPGDHFWLLERSSGFDRGGRVLTVYRLQ